MKPPDRHDSNTGTALRRNMAEMISENSAYTGELYEAYLADPHSVPASWADYFRGLQHQGDVGHQQVIRRMRASHRVQAAGRPVPCETFDVEYPSRAIFLAHGYRVHGHLHARLDPLNLQPVQPSPELELNYYGLSQKDLDVEFPTGDMVGPGRLPLREIVRILENTYCGSIGPEFMHITDSARKHWLQSRLEGIQSRPNFDADTRRHIFNKIMHAEELERFLHTRYAGQKRFSLEGGESLIPLLDALIQHSGSRGTREVIMAMAHRGRLNVLANILGKSSNDIFAEFEGRQFADAEMGAGDVKYHLGFSSDIRTAGGIVHLSLAFNPSHLEIITPVAAGSVRARQCRRGDTARNEVMAIFVHGDAAFAGQGVVAETLNLSKLGGFRTGGSIHVVVNNQIGFTTNPYDSRSTLYCTDIAKMVQAPILHVNGDDPEAVTLAAMLAIDYRYHFKDDVVIDLVCYRRHGHNEADEPSVTQPVMYRKIAEHPTVESSYRDKLVKEGVLKEGEAEQMVEAYRAHLDEVRRSGEAPARPNSLNGRWEGFQRADAEPDTTVDTDTLSRLVREAHRVPDGFELHKKVQKIFDARIEMMHGKQPIDWGCAEIMAYASLLEQGGWVRLSGQDTGRGTFFHRHAVVYDQKTGKSFLPLKQVGKGELSRLIVVDSMLSEEAVMAFEYGYSVAEPRALVIWEAQYGDFANNAQVVIDQFICAGESKWNRMSGLTLWLPHGYEGQGAEHSSARLERFLQLCAEENMQVVCPTTPAQLFHLFRRQFMIRVRKPLILMAPKSMLRQRLSFSDLSEFSEGHFHAVLPEPDDSLGTEGVHRVLMCSGKVYYDLLSERQLKNLKGIAIVRIERLYPFPREELRSELGRYKNAKEVVWVQEEPLNQGAWLMIKSDLKRAMHHEWQKIAFVARPPLAPPAVGSAKKHAEQQEGLVQAALGKLPPQH